MSETEAAMAEFAAEIGFKVQGAAMFPRKGTARAATPEEIALWSRVHGLLAELEATREPVCNHPVVIRHQTNSGFKRICKVCQETL